MELLINKKVFCDFLYSVIKFTDKGTLSFEKDNINILTYISDNVQTIIFHNKINQKNSIESPLKLSFPSFKRLYQLFQNIPDNEVKLNYNNKSISYISSSYSFNYNLISETFLEKNILNLEKINSIPFNTSFKINKTFIDEIIKLSSSLSELITSKDADKIYISSNNNKLIFNITDKTNSSIDSVNRIIETSNIKSFDELILNMQIFRILSLLNVDIFDVNINTDKSIIIFESDTLDSLLKVVVSSKLK